MHLRKTTHTAIGFALALAVLTTSAFAAPKKSDAEKKKSQKKTSKQQQQMQLPKSLSNLDLSKQQKQKIKSKMKKVDRQMKQTWKDFHAKHMQVVQLEAAWAAAVRDTLSEEDRQKFDQKRKEHHMKRKMQKQSKEKSRPGANQAFRKDQQDREQKQKTAAKKKSNKTDKQDSAQKNQQAQAEKAKSKESTSKKKRTAAYRGDQQKMADKAEEEAQLWVITVTSPVRYLEGARQNEMQKRQCHEACREYSKKIRSVWNDVRNLHSELVRLEAKRLEIVEHVLTEDQLEQLQADRKSPARETASSK